MKNFEIKSGKVVLSDPCYEIPTWCQGIVENVKNGKWLAGVYYSNVYTERVAVLHAYNLEAVTNNPSLKAEVEDSKGSILPFIGGVDSGQFGFFDFDAYRDEKTLGDSPVHDFGEDDDNPVWYRACCHLTLGSEGWGTIPFGAVASSGWGDGTYDVRGTKDENGQYVGFSVTFIDDDEDEDEDDFEDDENDEHDDL